MREKVLKRISVILILLSFLPGCSSDGIFKIEMHTWLMTTVQSMKEEGQAIAYGPRGISTLETGVAIRLECKAEDGNLILTDKTNDQTYTGTYQLTETDLQAVNYETVISGTEGIAVVSMTTYYDGSQEPTLIIRLNDYVLNFFASRDSDQ